MSAKQATVRVIAGFVMPGRQPPEVGEIVTVSESFARELIHTGKAERYIPPTAPKGPEPGPAIVSQVPALETQDPTQAQRGRKSKD